MAGPRSGSYMALVLFLCLVIVYMMSPTAYHIFKKDDKQKDFGKHYIPLFPPAQLIKQVQVAQIAKPISYLIKPDQLIQPTIRNTSVDTHFSVKEFAERLEKIKGTKRLLVATDSHGHGLQAIFKKHLPGWKVKVSFFGGYTVEEVYQKVEDMLPSLSNVNHSFVILHAGTNDFYNFIRPRPRKPKPGQYKEKHSDSYIISSAERALQALTKHFPKASIIYSANLPRADIPEYPPRKKFVNNEIKTKMAAIPRTYFIDHSPLFCDAAGQPDKRLLKPDLLHLNAVGRDLIVRNLVRKMANIP